MCVKWILIWLIDYLVKLTGIKGWYNVRYLVGIGKMICINVVIFVNIIILY